MKGYKINYTDSTIEMNLQFSKAASMYGTEEYRVVQSIIHDYPHFTLVTKRGREPKTSHQFKRLTYANMENYINAQIGSDVYLAAFEVAKRESKSSPSPYKFVRDWFIQTFPSYRECKTFDHDNIVALDPRQKNSTLDLVSSF